MRAVRSLVHQRCGAGAGRWWPALIALSVVLHAGAARARPHDVRLLNLCPVEGRAGDGFAECTWLRRDGAGALTGLAVDADAHESFRSLMSELGAVLAPHVVSPASTLGFAGFQLSAELATTSISKNERFWDGTEAVSPAARTSSRPAAALNTVGVYVRKGIWLPIPSMEAGAGVVHLTRSQMLAYQGYLKFALHEGFQSWPIPSVAGRVGLSHVTGIDDARLDVLSVDALASKAIGVGGTFRMEPFAGGSLLYVRARSALFDLTPGCDGVAAFQGSPSAGSQCTPAQLGTRNDLELGNYQFDDQSVITRKAVFAGVKLRFSKLHLSVQYTRVFESNSRDSTTGGQGARDDARDQDRFALSTGLDF